MKHGSLYNIINNLIEKFKYLNLVEYFKYLLSDNSDKINSSRFAVDLFIILKWVFLIIVIILGISNTFLIILFWYLIISNLYTYFYYHIWTKALANENHFSSDRIKRRFFSLISAIAFNILSFSYLFAFGYFEEYTLISGASPYINSFLLSISNSLAIDYAPMQAISTLGNFISILQTLISFIFLSMILSNSIPQINKK